MRAAQVAQGSLSRFCARSYPHHLTAVLAMVLVFTKNWERLAVKQEMRLDDPEGRAGHRYLALEVGERLYAHVFS